MSGAVQPYGHNGPCGGDTYVSDLLRRTVEGQWAATSALSTTMARVASVAISPLFTDLPTMTVVHAQKCADLRWQMATAYLDGVVEMYRNDDALSQEVYSACDSLCDDAREASRRATQSWSNHENGLRVRLTQGEILEDFAVNNTTYAGVWNALEVVIDRVREDFVSLPLQQVPTRFQGLVQDGMQRLRSHLELFEQLRSEWQATSITQNKLELVRDARSHAKEVFQIGQQLWAPYLHGTKYTAALTRKLTLGELTLADPWILTDPRQRQAKERDNESHQSLADFWESVIDIRAAVELAEQVNHLLKAKSIRRRTGRGYPMVPWPSQFLVRHRISFGSTNLEPGELIAYFGSRNAEGRVTIQVRRTGKLTRIAELLGFE